MAVATSDETRFAMPGLSDEGIDYTFAIGRLAERVITEETDCAA
jgi:hypothetical protein